MNAVLTTSLPPVLANRSLCGLQRRRQIGSYRLSSQGIDRFNHVLSSLGRPLALDSDQIATAARLLEDAADGQDMPACIEQRLQQAEALSCMFQDQGWKPADEAIKPVRAVLAYLQDAEDLIPDWMPRVGRLDDAIVIETAWPQLSGEMLSYLDFRRLREIESGMADYVDGNRRFGRKEWELARHAEVALHTHYRRVRESSYVPASAALFRVH